MEDYVIAIPTYGRPNQLVNKTLNLLRRHNIPYYKIVLFVASPEQKALYDSIVPREWYANIVVGELGIPRQRNKIQSYYFKDDYVISMDDDIEEIYCMKNGKLFPMENLDEFIKNAYNILMQKNLKLWGIYPVKNPFYMYNKITTDLRFCIGVMHGFINDPVNLSLEVECKEDYEFTILCYLRDGGVVRFNDIAVKTKFNADGGLGRDRWEMNKHATEYLMTKYPGYVRRCDRKNGMPEVKLISP